MSYVIYSLPHSHRSSSVVATTDAITVLPALLVENGYNKPHQDESLFDFIFFILNLNVCWFDVGL